MKIQLNTAADVERFVGADPTILAAIKLEVARGFEAAYIKPVANAPEVKAIRKAWREKLRTNKVVTNELVREALTQAIETDVQALLADKEFVRQAVNYAVESFLSVEEGRVRASIGRLINTMLNEK